MNVRIFLSMVILAVAAPTLSAQLYDVKISPQRETLDNSKERSGIITTTTKEVAYNLEVQSTTFKELTDVQIKYMIFYSDPTFESKDKARLAAITGAEVIAKLPGRGKVEIQTKPVSLASEALDAGWSSLDSGKSTARDEVKGLWIRAYAGGKMVGEYMNPSTLSKKNDWKE